MPVVRDKNNHAPVVEGDVATRFTFQLNLCGSETGDDGVSPGEAFGS